LDGSSDDLIAGFCDFVAFFDFFDGNKESGINGTGDIVGDALSVGDAVFCSFGEDNGSVGRLLEVNIEGSGEFIIEGESTGRNDGVLVGLFVLGAVFIEGLLVGSSIGLNVLKLTAKQSRYC